MIIKNWKYTNKLVIEEDVDEFYCNILHRYVDLGWRRGISTVHGWISVLNQSNSDLYKQGIKTDSLGLSKKTFELLKISEYDYFDGEKIGAYKLYLSDTVEYKKILLYSNNKIVGKINIK